jgi:hypothetical protein
VVQLIELIANQSLQVVMRNVERFQISQTLKRVLLNEHNSVPRQVNFVYQVETEKLKAFYVFEVIAGEQEFGA